MTPEAEAAHWSWLRKCEGFGVGDGLCEVLITQIDVWSGGQVVSCSVLRARRGGREAAGFEGSGGFLVVRDVQASLTAAVRSSHDAPESRRSTLARTGASAPKSLLFLYFVDADENSLN